VTQASGTLIDMNTAANTLQFAEAARALSRSARERELVVPAFRSPPRLLGVDRSIRRQGDHFIVAVRTRGRPWVAVAADMIEGIIYANGLVGGAAVRVRGALWAALGFAVEEPVAPRRAA
jgi:hypothetical protein